MHDPLEYPGYTRHHVWYVDQAVAAGATLTSPVFNLDRSMGPTVARAIPAGSVAGSPNDLFRPIPIGIRFIANFAEVGLINPALFSLFGSGEEDMVPNTIILNGVAIPTNGNVLIEGNIGFPYFAATIASVLGSTVVGGFRVFPP